jgi:hypothetical protein
VKITKLRRVEQPAMKAVMGALLVAPLAIVVLLLALTPVPQLFIPATDLLVYERYGAQLLAGAVPNRDFAVEYPPLALLPMALPKLLWPFGDPSDLGYVWRFTLIEGTLACLTGGLIAAVSERPVAAVATWVVLVLASATPVAWRYDLWPAALVLVALVAADRGRPGLAGAAIGAGVMLKLFPLVVLPILVVRATAMRDRHGLIRLLLGSGVVVGGIVAVSVAAAGLGAFHWLAYQVDRGLQLETVGAGLVLLGHLVGSVPVTVVDAFGSLQLSMPTAPDLVGAIVTADSVFTVLGVGLVAWLATVRFRREWSTSGRIALESVAMASVAALVALLVTSKVFSAQYLLWFLPLVPLLPLRQRGLAIAIAAVSAFIYPMNYEALWQLDPGLILVLNARNLLLVGLLAWAIVELRRGPRPAAAAFGAQLA